MNQINTEIAGSTQFFSSLLRLYHEVEQETLGAIEARYRA
jgi:hypothetical protein